MNGPQGQHLEVGRDRRARREHQIRLVLVPILVSYTQRSQPGWKHRQGAHWRQTLDLEVQQGRGELGDSQLPLGILAHVELEVS